MTRRRTKKTRLVYCEGAHDKAFLDCLKSVYCGAVYVVDVKRGTGGDQVHLVEEAIKKGKVYDEFWLKIDGDRNCNEMAEAEQLADDSGLILLKTIPCIERLLIRILEPSKSINSWTSRRLKSYFQANYISENRRADVRVYQNIFTKEALDRARVELADLDVIIKIFL